MNEYSTQLFQDSIERCESTEEFKALLSGMTSQKEEWCKYFSNLMETKKLSISAVADKCNVSRQAVMKWQKGSIPKSRDMFIRIALAFDFSLDEVDTFLKRYGRYPELYAKTLDDAIYIFILSSDAIEHSYRSFVEISERIKISMDMVDDTSEYTLETGAYMRMLADINSVSELIEFIDKHSKQYKRQYEKLYSYIKIYIQSNLLDETANDSVNLLADSQQWSSSLRTCVSEINNHKWYPQRDKLISLGIHLNMDIEQINYMLKLAHMGELYAKNPFESSIIYAVNSAMIEDYMGITGSDLCWYVKNILEALDYSDVEFFLEELPKGQEDDF